MFTVIAIMLAGVLIGYLARAVPMLQKVGKSISVTIILLLFLLGMSVGSNETIVSELGRLGWVAVVIALAGTCGSVAAAWLIVKFYNERNKRR
jgi:uncharacterized membrane protein YbjE (DUF340 family)